MSDRIVNIGIIGCGGIANGKHLPALKKLPNVRMVAFCDIIPERAEKAAKEYGVPEAKVFTDYKEMLKLQDIEVVHVLTPNRSHSFITVDALEAGKHVMCEKPMAINAAEAKKMVEAAKRTGKKLTIGYQNRFRPEYRTSRESARQARWEISIMRRQPLFAAARYRPGAYSLTSTSRAAVLLSISEPMRSILPFGQ